MGSAAEQQTPERVKQDCLDRMEALGGEFRLAIRAIAANDISALEASVLRQVEGSAGLRAALLGCDPLLAPREWVSGTRFEQAARDLSRIAREYAGLLEHSGRSMQMLEALYGQRSEVAAGSSGRSGRQEWSWEV